jgi:hypothetical protein
MELSVHGSGPATPFLRAKDRFETEYDLSLPVEVRIRDDPDERTWAGHDDDGHVLNISRQAATSAMATQLALHELAHMRRHEDEHPSHVQSTEEALFLGLAGREVERRRLAGCYQIANHMKDVYADDITLSVGRADKLVAFLESELAAAIADRPSDRPADARRESATTDPEMSAINAAFALGLLERHDLLDPGHHIYDLARVARRDAPHVDFERFKRTFRSLSPDPGESDYRKALVETTREYATGGGAPAAD